jgi:hypothetical protein
VHDARSGWYYHAASGYYFDASTSLYYAPATQKYYRCAPVAPWRATRAAAQGLHRGGSSKGAGSKGVGAMEHVLQACGRDGARGRSMPAAAACPWPQHARGRSMPVAAPDPHQAGVRVWHANGRHAPPECIELVHGTA